MVKEQLGFTAVNQFFLGKNIDEARRVIKWVAAVSKNPIIIQFSGGHDSMALLGLVREADIKDYIAAYMATGMEFKGVVNFVKETCAKLGVRLLISHPGLHKGNIFKRIEQFQSFPNLGSFEGGGKRLWCCRDLKLRPQKKLLAATFGKGPFYKLEGIRRAESVRRRYIYKDYTGTPIREDQEQPGSFEVFPIVNWTDDDVTSYLRELHLPELKRLYDDFGVSGCSWCPFYGPDIYSKVLQAVPDHYDRWIEWENRLGTPSVMGGVFLRDIKTAVTAGKEFLAPPAAKTRRPCMVEWEGNLVPTCSVYGHLYIDGKCLRCDEAEPVKV